MFFLARWWCNIFHCKNDEATNLSNNNNNNDNMSCTSGTKDAKCIQYTGVALSCAGILKNDYLDTILSKINNKLCSSSGGSVTSVAISSTDLSVSGSPITTAGTITLSINSNAVTYAKIQQSGAVRLLGNPSGVSANVSEISLSTGLGFSGTSLLCTDNATNQKIQGIVDGVLIGTRRAINLISGSNVTITGTDDNTNDRVNITVNSTGGGGSGTPGGSDTQLQYNNAGTFGGTIAGVYTSSGNLFIYTAQAATDVPLTLKGAGSQSANILNIKNSSNAVIASISAAGNITGTNLSGTNTGDQTITLTGDVTGSGTGSFAATIAAGAVSNAKFRDSGALSVVGRSSNSTGSVADITAGSDGYVLRRSGTSLGFGQVLTAGIADANVTKAKFEDVTTQTLLGRYAGTNGVMQEITLDSTLSLDTGTGVLSVVGGSGTSFDTLGSYLNNFNSTVGASTTGYTSVVGGSLQSTASARAITIPGSGYISNLFILASGTQPSSGSITITLQKGSTIAGLADTALTKTIAANTAAGSGTVYSNTVNKISVNAGDILVVKIVNAASATSLTINSISMLLTNQ